MNKHLLSAFVLIVFAFFALFPASTKSITDQIHVAAKPKTHQSPISKTLILWRLGGRSDTTQKSDQDR
jgi:hypothetical protein